MRGSLSGRLIFLILLPQLEFIRQGPEQGPRSARGRPRKAPRLVAEVAPSIRVLPRSVRELDSAPPAPDRRVVRWRSLLGLARAIGPGASRHMRPVGEHLARYHCFRVVAA